MAYSQYFQGTIEQRVPNASITDTTPPTFAGITSVTPGTDGTLTLFWSAATDATLPLNYLLYVAVGSVSAASLFVVGNLVSLAPNAATSQKVITLADQTTYFVNGSVYTVGVRAKDAVGNVNTNTAILTTTAIASGNLPSIYQTLATNIAATEALLATDHTNLASDHTNLAAANVVYAGHNATMATHLATFSSNLSTFSTDLASLATQITTLTTQNSTYSGLNSSLTTTASSLSSSASSLSSSTTTLSGQLTTLATDLTNLATQITTFANENTTLSGTASALAATATKLASSVNLLLALVV